MKKVLILLAIAAVLVLGYSALNFFYLTRLASPKETVSIQSEDFNVSVEYCRPSKKGRLIFGSKDEGALQPFGQYWRLGANRATEIEFDKGLVIGDARIKAGRYRLYAIPGEETWDLVFNSELGKWGYQEANHDLDVLTITAPAEKLEEVVELFTITILQEEKPKNYTLNLFWDQTLVRIPFTYE